MKKSGFRAVVGGVVLALSVGAVAQMAAEDMIKVRQSGYTFIAWNMEKIGAQVDGTVEFNAQQVQAAANAIAAIANSGMGALYAPGTDEGTGWKTTRLKSDFFKPEEQARVQEVGANFAVQATRLREVAAEGDRRAIAAQFSEVRQACSACHQNYRARE